MEAEFAIELSYWSTNDRNIVGDASASVSTVVASLLHIGFQFALYTYSVNDIHTGEKLWQTIR